MSAENVLVVDIGGTNVRFALAQLVNDQIKLDHIARYPVIDFTDFDSVLAAYLERLHVLPERAAFAFAGPKFDDQIRMTNADWIVGRSHLISKFGFKDIVLMNDFAGMARGAITIPDSGLSSIIAGTLNHSKNIAVLGPGTGLGLAGVTPDTGAGRGIISTEGGHCAFAPQDKIEIDVLSILLKRHDFVSAEMILSGDGLFRLYSALCEVYDQMPICVHQTEIIPQALKETGSIAARALTCFCNILGGYAGSAAVMLGASGGVVISGGVSAHIAPFIERSDFTNRFLRRAGGTLFVKDIPVLRITEDYAALYGAASVWLKP